jgi:putative endonuclease
MTMGAMRRIRQPCVYLLASGERASLYVCVTSDLTVRVYQHGKNLVDGFTRRYGVHLLVWFEMHEMMESAIQRDLYPDLL